jgi:Spy/CpxP family protein refolding chaperone
MKSETLTCQTVTDAILSAGNDATDPAIAEHLAACPRCAELAAISARVGMTSRAAIDVAPGFSSRMIAGATARLQRRQRQRVIVRAGSAAAVVAAASLLAVWLPGLRPERLPLTEVPSLTANLGDDALAAALRAEPELPALAEDIAETAESTEATEATELGREDSARLERLDAFLHAALGADEVLPGGTPADVADGAAELDGELALSPAQQQRIDAILAETERAVAQARKGLDAARAELDHALDAPNPDETEIAKLVDRVSLHESQVRKAHLRGWLRARRVLTPAQRQALGDPRRSRQVERHADPIERGPQREAIREAMAAKREAMREAMDAQRQAMDAQRQAMDAVREAMAAKREALREAVRAQGEDPEAVERALKEAEREIERALEDADIDGTIERAMKDAERERERAMKDAERERARAMKDAERARRDAEKQQREQKDRN